MGRIRDPWELLGSDNRLNLSSFPQRHLLGKNCTLSMLNDYLKLALVRD